MGTLSDPKASATGRRGQACDVLGRLASPAMAVSAQSLKRVLLALVLVFVVGDIVVIVAGCLLAYCLYRTVADQGRALGSARSGGAEGSLVEQAPDSLAHAVRQLQEAVQEVARLTEHSDQTGAVPDYQRQLS